MIPPVSGGIERPEGSKARGGSEAPEGSQHRGGGERTAPHIIVDDEEDGAPQEGSVPSGRQEGERASGGGLEVPPTAGGAGGPDRTPPSSGAEVGGSAEVPRAETTVAAPASTVEETGVHLMTLGVGGGAKGAPSSQKSAAPRARYV